MYNWALIHSKRSKLSCQPTTDGTTPHHHLSSQSAFLPPPTQAVSIHSIPPSSPALVRGAPPGHCVRCAPPNWAAAPRRANSRSRSNPAGPTSSCRTGRIRWRTRREESGCTPATRTGTTALDSRTRWRSAAHRRRWSSGRCPRLATREGSRNSRWKRTSSTAAGEAGDGEGRR